MRVLTLTWSMAAAATSPYELARELHSPALRSEEEVVRFQRACAAMHRLDGGGVTSSPCWPARVV